METRGEEKKGIFYGWVIVLVATLALAVSNGLTTLGIAVFSRSVREEFVAGGVVPLNGAESMIATAGFLTFLLAGFFSPVTGYLIKRFSLRLLMIAGCLVLGGALLLHSQAQTPSVVYIARILMGASLGFVGVMPQVVLVSNWFRHRRGTSLGIVLTGTSLGGFAVPLIATPLLINYGWRTAMMLMSLLVWLVLLPAIIFLVKNRPQEMGQYPDGDLPADDAPNDDDGSDIGDGETGSGFTLGRALATPVFWVFALCAAALFYTIFVVTQQFILYLQTPKIGFSPSAAGYFLSILSAVSMGGKFLFGWLSDRWPPPRVMLVCCAVMFASTFIFLNLNAGNAIFFILIFGIGYGGTFVLLQLLVAEFFGRREYGKILGVIVMIETIGAAIGGKITGYLADADGGDYTRAFYGVIISTGFALALTLILNRKRFYLTF
jgi:sugar phosphate permease